MCRKLCLLRTLQIISLSLVTLANVACCLVGLGVVLCGVSFNRKAAAFTLDILGVPSQPNSALHQHLVSPPVSTGFLITGSVMMAVSLFVFCAIVARWRFVIYAYAGFAGLVFLGLVASEVAVAVLLEPAKMAALSKTCLSNDFNDIFFNMNGNTSLSLGAVAWNTLMLGSSCCGFTNYTDFQTAKSWTRSYPDDPNQAIVPVVCCHGNQDYKRYSFWRLYVSLAAGSIEVAPVDRSCPSSPNVANSHFHQPCHRKVEETSKQWRSCGLVAGAIALGVQLVYFVLCCFLCAAYYEDASLSARLESGQVKYEASAERQAAYDSQRSGDSSTRC